MVNDSENKTSGTAPLVEEFASPSGEKNLSTLLDETAARLQALAPELSAEKIREALEESPLVGSYKELLQETTTDELTGLLNRRGFINALVARIRETKVSDAKLETAVVFIDLDGFKAVNDALGHDKGDEALIEVAQRLEATFTRRGDKVVKGRSTSQAGESENTVGRLGGDEMVLLLPTDQSASKEGRVRKFDEEAVKNKIRTALDGLVFYDARSKPYPIGASIGAVSFTKQDINEGMTERKLVEAFLSEADKKMYSDKRGKEARLKLACEKAASKPSDPALDSLG